jgi:hypothetical protein
MGVRSYQMRKPSLETWGAVVAGVDQFRSSEVSKTPLRLRCRGDSAGFCHCWFKTKIRKPPAAHRQIIMAVAMTFLESGIKIIGN